MNTVATKQVEEFTAEAKKTVEEGVEKVTKGVEEATQFGQENMEAIVASGKVVAKAAKDLNAEMLAFSKKTYQDSMAAAKELTSAKSASEFFEKQTEFAKFSFDAYIAEATKLNEIYAAATKQAIEPINARFNAASEMVKSQTA